MLNKVWHAPKQPILTVLIMLVSAIIIIIIIDL